MRPYHWCSCCWVAFGVSVGIGGTLCVGVGVDVGGAVVGACIGFGVVSVGIGIVANTVGIEMFLFVYVSVLLGLLLVFY